MPLMDAGASACVASAAKSDMWPALRRWAEGEKGREFAGDRASRLVLSDVHALPGRQGQRISERATSSIRVWSVRRPRPPSRRDGHDRTPCSRPRIPPRTRRIKWYRRIMTCGRHNDRPWCCERPVRSVAQRMRRWSGRRRRGRSPSSSSSSFGPFIDVARRQMAADRYDWRRAVTQSSLVDAPAACSACLYNMS